MIFFRVFIPMLAVSEDMGTMHFYAPNIRGVQKAVGKILQEVTDGDAEFHQELCESAQIKAISRRQLRRELRPVDRHKIRLALQIPEGTTYRVA